MTGNQIIFYLLALLTLGSAVLAVSTRQIFRAAIFLLFALMGMAGLFFWMNYAFIAAVQIVVYVGGITVLIIFSIFLTQATGEKLPQPLLSRRFIAAMASVCGLLFTLTQIFQHQFKATKQEAIDASIQQIGLQMLGTNQYGYALPFELISMLLLAALVGCIVIAIRLKPTT
jgi:NADH-quinone oxidoreductase subunit J